jgi:predicted nucleic acid-binding protein
VSAVFADTFYWIALADFTDSLHERAVALTADYASSAIVTTEEVLAEYLTFFSGAPGPWRREVAASVQDILPSPAIRVVPQSHSSFMAGLKLYEERPDKGYSLADCISMQTMRWEGLTDILTNDRHFEREGFRALFRS